MTTDEWGGRHDELTDRFKFDRHNGIMRKLFSCVGGSCDVDQICERKGGVMIVECKHVLPDNYVRIPTGQYLTDLSMSDIGPKQRVYIFGFQNDGLLATDYTHVVNLNIHDDMKIEKYTRRDGRSMLKIPTSVFHNCNYDKLQQFVRKAWELYERREYRHVIWQGIEKGIFGPKGQVIKQVAPTTGSNKQSLADLFWDTKKST